MKKFKEYIFVLNLTFRIIYVYCTCNKVYLYTYIIIIYKKGAQPIYI